MGTLVSIAVAPKIRAAMELRDSGEVTVKKGIVGDARGHFPGRQVTVLFADAWRATCQDLNEDLPWTLRRANLLVEGMSAPRRKGARLRIGTVVLEVTEETKPCNLMERAQAGLKNALKPDWRGGVCCKVIEGGYVQSGDAVELETA